MVNLCYNKNHKQIAPQPQQKENYQKVRFRVINRRFLRSGAAQRRRAAAQKPLAAQLENPYSRRYLPTGSLARLAEGWRAPSHSKKG